VADSGNDEQQWGMMQHTEDKLLSVIQRRSGHMSFHVTEEEDRAWTDQFDDWPQIRSELAVAVFDAVRAAGMTFPFPQREVRLLRDHDGESR